MPFAAKTQLDDPNDPRKNAQGGINISGQSNTVAANIPGQDSASTEKQKGSGQYANIQSYLDANKQQGDQMGTRIADSVSSKAEDASQKIQSYESKAPTVQAYDPNEALGRATSLNDAEKAQYKTTKQTGGYTGPSDVSGIEGYQDANKAGTEASQLVKNSGTEQGQRELLKNTYQRPSYSAGENNLDQAIVQGSAGSRSKMEELGQKYSGLAGALDGANQKVGTAVNTAQQQALANKQAFGAAEQTARDNLMNPIQQRAAEANSKNKDLVGRIQNDASDNILSDETLQLLGLSEGQSLYDLNIGNYITPDLSEVGINNAANADERSKYAALASLFGDPTMNQLTADGKEIKPVTFNKDKFDSDYTGKDAEYKSFYDNGSRGYFNNYLSSVPQGQYRQGLLPQLKEMSLSEIETVLLPQQQQLVAQLGPEFASITTDPIQKYLTWAKTQQNANRKVTKG